MSRNKAGFLLIHGFTGTHYEMEPLAEYLRNKEFTVENIILPGHETSEEDLITKTWIDWIEFAQDELEKLKKSCEFVFVCGLSMGGVISLHLAKNNQDISGIISMATPYRSPDWRIHIFDVFPFVHYLYPKHKSKESGWEDLEALESHRCYDNYPTKAAKQVSRLFKSVKRDIPFIKIPILIIQSKNDPTVPTEHPKWIFGNVASKDKKLIWIEKGGHVIPEDAGRFQLFEEVEKWIEERI